MTDVTGFGLVGHLSEVMTESGVSASLGLPHIPVLKECRKLAEDFETSGGISNWLSFQSGVTGTLSNQDRVLISDPQTNGGILSFVNPDAKTLFENFCISKGMSEFSIPIGEVRPPNQNSEIVIEVTE